MTRRKRSRETSPSDRPLVVNGWQIFAHPLFLDQLARLVAAVELESRKDPDGYKSGANAKLLASIHKLAFETIPEDPSRAVHRQGNTLGGELRHWFRAKFGRRRFRLFFRYRADPKIIVYAWVNDEQSKRTYGSKSDAYAVFKAMVDSGNPPNAWDDLLEACRKAAPSQPLSRLRDLIHRFGL
ncbi:type II toxin-antitoxin system YhaV family toxin [Propylenella binzhouense]|uniref:Type II toxin-antitoxin system YhaV family toxin n=1 Tax=Propylenella binzhouense TaxID=2555902 RepID=A0A964T7M9_9HYPH|nr:type II toxin-antitoxin system YhaV family toxin [Propylenella binzhouense]MYZ50051.1 type II toxin-antitoxin system YhaV family toxin [Propylenella binzhouense]